MSKPQIEIEELKKKAKWLRLKTLERVYTYKKGHIGGALSSIEILTILYYSNILKVNSSNSKDRNRDRFILSKGHSVVPLYIILQDLGFFKKEVKLLYPDISIPGIELTTGSLGHGLGVGSGIALAAQLDKKSYHTFVLLGDGECYEGSIWEAAMFASHHRLNNLTAIIDRNQQCVTDFTEDCVKLEPLCMKWESFGWEVYEFDGHDPKALNKYLSYAKDDKRTEPLVLIAKTIKGKGVSFMEKNIKWHHGVPTEEEYSLAKNELTS